MHPNEQVNNKDIIHKTELNTYIVTTLTMIMHIII